MTTKRTSLRQAINAKCRECSYDPLSPGKWREQVAVCGCSGCPLYDVRPVPRNCIVDGEIIAPAVHALARELEKRQARANAR